MRCLQSKVRAEPPVQRLLTYIQSFSQSSHVSSPVQYVWGAAVADVVCGTVEKAKGMLTRNDKHRCSVDWLTEVTFRLTDAWVNKRELSTVSMRSPMRLQKVRQPTSDGGMRH